MFSIKKAEDFIKTNRGSINTKFRPKYHMAAPIGWINDPNGFCFFKNQYHMFCQYYPYEAIWGPMHWGHWASSDCVNWRWQGVALAPDSLYDNMGCFSGTALVENDTLYIVYTGVHKNKDGTVVQEQCIAKSEDGINFVKYKNNPIITSSMLPEGFSIVDFRDPKISEFNNGYRILVAGTKYNIGKILSYKSKDKINWEFDGIFTDNISTMPECPDYFHLQGNDVFVTCLMNQKYEELKYQNDHHAVVYYLGKETDGVFSAKEHRSIDLGQDFYAPQTLVTKDGRAIMIAWMQMWGEAPPNYYFKHGWQGQYTFPREISIKNNRLYQNPIKEIEKLYKNKKELFNQKINNKVQLLSGKQLRIMIKITNIGNEGVQMHLFEKGDSFIALSFDRRSGILRLDRSRTYYPVLALPTQEAHDIAAVQLNKNSDELFLDILLDTCSIEVFANHGEAALTSLAYCEEDADGISFFGDFYIDKLTAYQLN
jgi:beta-fructofuranosidase